MLEKIAEAIREEATSVHVHDQVIPCITCGYFQTEPGGCKGCCLPEVGDPDGSLMLARWAVKQVAPALAEELSDFEGYNEQFLDAAKALEHDAALANGRRADKAAMALGKEFAALVREARE